MHKHEIKHVITTLPIGNKLYYNYCISLYFLTYCEENFKKDAIT